MKRITSVKRSSVLIGVITVIAAVSAAFVPISEKPGGHSHGSAEDKHDSEPIEEDSSHGEHSH